jgi:hypothetical protein
MNKMKHQQMAHEEEESPSSLSYDNEGHRSKGGVSISKLSHFQKGIAAVVVVGFLVLFFVNVSLSSSLQRVDKSFIALEKQVKYLNAERISTVGNYISTEREKDCPHIDFYTIAKKHGTDKVTFHHYYHMYETYLSQRRCDNLTFMEIGLGCNMDYGPGASYQVWLDYFPNAQIYFIEYDGECVKHWESKMKDPRIKIFVGDQADIPFLESVIEEVGRPFDYIIDDGGHFRYQQVASFETLFPYVKPAGIYFIEDLECSFESKFDGGFNVEKTILNYVKDIITDLTTRNYIKSPQKVPISSWVQGVDCMEEVCAFRKGLKKE